MPYPTPSFADLIPPLADPSLFHPVEATRALFGVQRAALAVWLDSCQQAQELGLAVLGWSDRLLEGLVEAERPR